MYCVYVLYIIIQIQEMEQQYKLDQGLVDQVDNPPQLTTKKVDGMFFNSMNGLKANSLKTQSYQIIRIIYTIVVLVVQYRKAPYDATFGLLLTAIVLAVITIFIQRSFVNYISRMEIFLEIAQRTAHVVEVPTQRVEQPQTINDLRCDVYAANVQLGQGIENAFQKNALQSRLKSVIRNIFFFDRKFTRGIYFTLDLLSFGIIVFFIVELALLKYHGAKLGLITAYVVVDGMNRIAFFILIALVAMCCPCLFCGLIYIFCTRHSPANAQKYAEELKPMKYSPSITLEHDHECPICRSGFQDDELIVVLQCKHNFHEDCVKQWFKVGNTCPVCRFSFSR